VVLLMYSKKYCAELVKMYYAKASPDFYEHEAVERALEKTDPEMRKEYDKLFSFFFENGRRNVNAVAIEFFISPATVYRRLDRLCEAVNDELCAIKNKSEAV